MGEYNNLIQYKFLLDNRDEFLKKFKEEGITFDEPVAYEYTYYKLPKDTDSFTVLRLKVSPNKMSVDMKIRNDKTDAWEHFESGIDNVEEMKSIFNGLGCEEVVTFHKNRFTHKEKDFRFDVDDNREIGVLLEIKFAEEKREYILDLLNKLGLKEENRDKRSILEIYLNKN